MNVSPPTGHDSTRQEVYELADAVVSTAFLTTKSSVWKESCAQMRRPGGIT